jgi:hypothetical protein
MTRRLMLIGLDGVECSLAERLMSEGRLPTMKGLRDRAARASLDHGLARHTGLAWEHVSTGLSPDDGMRWAAIDFDPVTYETVQRSTRLPPFPAALDLPALIFDAPYFALQDAPNCRGIVAWGAHDPGVPSLARPDSLTDELHARFGTYPAKPWTYGLAWPSAERTARMGRELAHAADVRFAAAEWLYAERFTDWRLGFMVTTELHSAAEGMWHGIDPDHPLAGHPSAGPARQGQEAIYEAIDRGLARLVDRLADTDFILFNLHGMGTNESDPGSMILLPELMFRHSFGRPLLRGTAWPRDDRDVPKLRSEEGWEASIVRRLPAHLRLPQFLARIKRRLGLTRPGAPGRLPVTWMPGARYALYWPKMQAFALPSFYDGRIRINLAGREAQGVVPAEAYESLCDELEALLLACRDPLTGRPAVREIHRNPHPPAELAPSEADLIVLWNPVPLGLQHPDHGTIGPVPFRRTGGHTGGDGFAWIVGKDLKPADLGGRSAFDVVPTAIEMLGLPAGTLSGASFASLLQRQSAGAGTA